MIGSVIMMPVGADIPLPWVKSNLGRPGKKLGKPGTEEWMWQVLTLRSGEVYMFHTEAP